MHARGAMRCAFVFAAAFFALRPASSQVVEYAGDSALVACELEGLLPASVAPLDLESIKAAPVFNDQRILGVMPDFQTVRDTTHPVAPLTGRQKWTLAARETIDPFNIATAFLTAAESQAGNETPKYGEGWANYGKRVAAAQLDFASQNFFSAGVLATLFHQDPRYFRRGPQSKFGRRILYSMSQLVVARNDSGGRMFNVANIGGMSMGIAMSNLYYPGASRSGAVMVSRIWTSMMGGAVGNLMSEFWPDAEQLERRLFHRK
jgi:hypothetical protein